jgi:hypothetical protein
MTRPWLRHSVWILFFILTPSARGLIYTGSLSSSLGEVDGKQVWIDPGPTTIEWTVTENLDSSWHYEYTLTVPSTQTEISHFIIEVSEGFGDADIFNQSGPFSKTEIMKHRPSSPASPSLPDDIYGIKFDDTTGTTLTIAFDSWRMPVWGDFYAKGGGRPPDEAWNMGFASPDIDPLDLPASGSIDNHILVPDAYIPEPATFLLLAFGVMIAVKVRRAANSN